MDPLVTLAPPSTDPVVTYAAPELPCPVVPLLNTTLPESPSVTAFADRTVTRPDDDTPPLPLTTLMESQQLPSKSNTCSYVQRLIQVYPRLR